MDVIADSDFWGVYRPNTSITSAQRDAVVGTAHAIRNARPGYVAGAPIAYPASLFGGPKLLNITTSEYLEILIGISLHQVKIPLMITLQSHPHYKEQK